MKTLDDLLNEHCRRSGVSPHHIDQIEKTFLAGAAAMAEIFAQGKFEFTLKTVSTNPLEVRLYT